MVERENKFYLGSVFDPQKGQCTNLPLLYDPADLTTHAVVVGMTGSGKTGLCIALLEEAALQGIPALLIDLKGDITNALLHFPDLRDEDFLPWINPDEARRAGKTLEQAAAETAARWRAGLAEWDIPPERLRALQKAVEFALYTPGSTVGYPLSILSSLRCPPLEWESNREILREQIAATVTAILGLVGLTEIDPVQSRAHILLANIFEQAWKQGKDLDLGELILQTQTPPFPKLGVFDVNTFFPEKDRFALAMQLNNILAAPAFQSWIEGEPLEVQRLLYTAQGRPRHSIFYLAHLSEAERMFFVTLLFSATESWMHSQPGTSTLRAILYFDEIYGYLPPVANPPSKSPILRMLKQARAFGVGLVLATQNPVDVDYKALANAGTWFIGKLQTEQDKQRLLEGLASALTGGSNRAAAERLISGLGKRVFLLHNVHASTPRPSGEGGALFQTRQTMNFLAGPLSRAQIPMLKQLAGSGEQRAVVSEAVAVGSEPLAVSTRQAPLASPSAAIQSPQSAVGSVTRPAIPAGIAEYFLPNNLTFTQSFKAAGRPYPQEAFSEGLLYKPALLAQASVRFLNRKYNLDYELKRTSIVIEADRRGLMRWEQHLAGAVDPAVLDASPASQARFASLEAPLSDAKTLNAIQKDFADWVYRAAQVTVRVNETLEVYAGPQVSQAEFRRLCADAARRARQAESEKVSATYERKLTALREKLGREQRELRQDEKELSQRKWEESGTHAENIASLVGLGRRRSLTTSLTKHRLTEQAKAEVEESEEVITDLTEQLAALEKEREATLAEINDRWGEAANRVSEITITPLKKDVLLELFGVAWIPYHLIRIGEQLEELPGYGRGG
jgi:hypothetical protein